MTKEQIEKYIALGVKKRLTATELSQLLTLPPYNYSVADVNTIYHEFKRRWPGPWDAPVQIKSKPLPIPETAKTHPVIVCKTGRANSGENIQPPSNYQPSILNRSGVKAYALDAATRIRAGKFKRVSPEFIHGVEAELENVLRAVGGSEDSEELPGEWDFLNRKQIFARVAEQLNRAVRKIILRKVRSHPSKGQTLR